MNLTRPICFFDIEGTGPDPATDRIVSLAIMKLTPGDLLRQESCDWWTGLFNPGRTMAPDVVAVHHITNEMAAGQPMFSERAGEAHRFIAGCDLGGFNLRNYDVPILWEEFARAGIEWNLDGIYIVDAGNIFMIREPRTLTAAVKFYCGREHGNAHTAEADTLATYQTLLGQMARYPDLANATVAELDAASKRDDRIDLAGKILRDAEGKAVYGFGKSKGVRVEDDPSLARWMLARDFTENTKAALRKLLAEAEYQESLFQ